MLKPQEFQWRREPAFFHATLEPGWRDRFKYFREIRFRGYHVFPERWHAESVEPLLFCRLMGDQITMKTGLLPRVIEASAAMERTGAKTDIERWQALSRQCSKTSEQLRASLVSEGWQDMWDQGLVKFVRIDDLEKIEGPPPEGAF